VLLRVGHDRRIAIPLEAVSRLEDAPTDAVERSGGGHVMQYRGDILPLVAVASILEATGGDPLDVPDAGPRSPSVPIVVCSDGTRRLGLVVSEILDIVDGYFELRPVTASPGILGCAVVGGLVTDVLDVDAAFGPPACLVDHVA
jgi:two-component system chemotaxis sensor kinase CheA